MSITKALYVISDLPGRYRGNGTVVRMSPGVALKRLVLYSFEGDAQKTREKIHAEFEKASGKFGVCRSNLNEVR
jgi:hypothetical protein